MSDVRIAGFNTSFCERSLARHQSPHVSDFYMSENVVTIREWRDAEHEGFRGANAILTIIHHISLPLIYE